MKKQISRQDQPIREKVLYDQKPHDLNYDLKYGVTHRKTVYNVPVFKKTMPRSTLVAGMTSSQVDSTGYGFVEETATGLEG